jgi:hypothetical protein
MGNLSDFERGQITGAHFAGTSVPNAAMLSGEQRVTASEVMPAHEDNWATQRERVQLTLTTFKRSKNYCSTGDRTEQNGIFFPQQLSDVNFTSPAL